MIRPISERIKKKIFTHTKRKNFTKIHEPRKLAIVSGCSRGIGNAITRYLLQQEISVAGISRTLIDIPQNGFFKSFQCDIRDYSSVESTVLSIENLLGSPSILINCAGISIDSLLVKLQNEDLNNVINTNLIGTIYLTKSVCKSMIKNKKGNIINIGSIVGQKGNVGQTAYTASKAALQGLTVTWAKELAPKNIRVNLIAPGLIESDMTSNIGPEKKQQLIDKILLKRFGSTEEIALTVGFLLNNSYITGQTIVVDGGFSL